MARLNLTIPDPLYERLERFRETVNISKVCAIALAKELEAMESSATMDVNPKARRLIERLQARKDSKERCYQRGYEEGETWVAENAEPREVRFVQEEWDLDDDETYGFDDVEFPGSFDKRAALQRWTQAEREHAGLDTIFRADPSRSKSDQDAFLRGWRQAVDDTWKAAEPALRWLKDEDFEY